MYLCFVRLRAYASLSCATNRFVRTTFQLNSQRLDIIIVFGIRFYCELGEYTHHFFSQQALVLETSIYWILLYRKYNMVTGRKFSVLTFWAKSRDLCGVSPKTRGQVRGGCNQDLDEGEFEHQHRTESSVKFTNSLRVLSLIQSK